LVEKGMKFVSVMLLQSMETGKEVLLSTQNIWKGLVKNRLRDSDFLLWLLNRNTPPPCSLQSHPTLLPGSLNQERQKGEEGIKQMSELAKIVQQQRLENKELEKLFSDSKIQALQLYVDLNQQ
jgi:hypothetical protein